MKSVEGMRCPEAGKSASGNGEGCGSAKAAPVGSVAGRPLAAGDAA